MSQVDYDQKIREINSLQISDAEKSKRIRMLMFVKNKNSAAKPVVPSTEPKVQEHRPQVVHMNPSTGPKVQENRPVDPFREQINSINRDTSLSHQQKHAKIKAMIDAKFPKSVTVKPSVSRPVDPFREQINSIHRDTSLSHQQKHAKIEAMINAKFPKASVINAPTAKPNVPQPPAPTAKPVVQPPPVPTAKPNVPQPVPSTITAKQNQLRDQIHAVQRNSSLSPQEKQAKIKALMEEMK
jgi:hypothetical protein